jgi:hypothetical protein
MTVPSNPHDESPHRLLQPTTCAPGLPPGYQPFGGAAPEALRQMIETTLQTVLAQQFAQWLGAAPYERTGDRRGRLHAVGVRALSAP